MSNIDYIIGGVLVLLVLRQIVERQITLRSLVLPVVLVGAAAVYYLRGIPTAGNDPWLIAILVLVGAAFGAACALTTHVRRGPHGEALSRAGWLAALLWIVGVGARMAFAYAADHGAGAAIARFSAQHQITGAEAWTAALVLMALAEVLVRLAVLQARGHEVRSSDRREFGPVVGA